MAKYDTTLFFKEKKLRKWNEFILFALNIN